MEEKKDEFDENVPSLLSSRPPVPLVNYLSLTLHKQNVQSSRHLTDDREKRWMEREEEYLVPSPLDSELILADLSYEEEERKEDERNVQEKEEEET